MADNIITFSSPFSSTNPTSWSDFLQLSMLQTKLLGHQVRPSAVMKGPLKIYFCNSTPKIKENNNIHSNLPFFIILHIWKLFKVQYFIHKKTYRGGGLASFECLFSIFKYKESLARLFKSKENVKMNETKTFSDFKVFCNFVSLKNIVVFT